MECDICSTKLAKGQGTVVSIKEMNAIARNGFGPHKLGIAATVGVMDILLPSANAEQLDAGWQERVLADSTPWLLCPRCYELTRPFAGQGTEKKWWQFWK